MREWEIGAVENIHGALPYIRFAPILAPVGVGVKPDRQVKFFSAILSAVFIFGMAQTASAQSTAANDQGVANNLVTQSTASAASAQVAGLVGTAVSTVIAPPVARQKPVFGCKAVTQRSTVTTWAASSTGNVINFLGRRRL